jgi:hypothetical protein
MTNNSEKVTDPKNKRWVLQKNFEKVIDPKKVVGQKVNAAKSN